MASVATGSKNSLSLTVTRTGVLSSGVLAEGLPLRLPTALDFFDFAGEGLSERLSALDSFDFAACKIVFIAKRSALA